MRVSCLFIMVGVLFFSCKKTTVTPPEALPPIPASSTTGLSLSIKINHVVNGTPLVLGATSYTTASSDTFSVNALKYYFTNITLTNQAGEVITLPESYYLIDQGDSTSKIITLQNIPEGDYASISFMIGVDSHRNTSGAQTGALDPLKGMFWDWNTGYIMAKMEGSSPQSGSTTKTLAFHIGGYSGVNSGVRTVSLPLPTSAHVHPAHQPKIILSADLAKWFSSVTPISFATTYYVATINTKSKSIADNYATMFAVTSVIN